MASQEDALVAAMAQLAPLSVAALPHALLLEVLSRVPLDCRLRCAAVCRAWRAALNERGLWRRLDLSTATGGLARGASDALLVAVAARAAGQLESLNVSGCTALSYDALLAVVKANSASLRELHSHPFGEMRSGWPVFLVKALLREAPYLSAWHAAVCIADPAVAHAMLRNEPPFTALRLHRLRLLCPAQFTGAEAAVRVLAADLAACSYIQELVLTGAVLDTPVTLDALVTPSLAARLKTLRLEQCRLFPASAPAVARLLRGGSLQRLEIEGGGDPFLDGTAAEMLGNALRACSTLTSFTLRCASLWHMSGAATALLGALTGHASLRTLDLSHNWQYATHPTVTGAALGALVGANAPALTELDVSGCGLGDEGLRPLFDALPANTHLTKLDCSGKAPTNAFACNTLLPAVRANGSLRQLSCTYQQHNASAATKHALAEAEALVAQRAAGR
jgi:hypothetical protein